MSAESKLGGGWPGLKRGVRAGAAASLLAVGAGCPVPAPAQTAGSGPAAAVDSVVVLEEAREAQAEFERTRIAHLPWIRAPSRGPCDERVGRFCWWHGDADDDWTPPPEPAPVRAARERLLERLAAAAGRIPGDAWILGQRVRYLVEAGRAEEARAIARASAAGAGWRAALEGYAHHAGGAFPEAEAAFDRALAALPAATRDTWTDAALLLDPRTRRTYETMGADARAALERRLWWLADPLWSVPGNERRAEHFARLVADQMQEGARSPWDVRWGADLRELLVRYGASIGWERVRPDAWVLGGGAGTAVVGHEPPGGRRFVPSRAALGGPTVAGRSAWDLDVERPRSTYAPGYARRFVALDAQVAAFRRGEDVAVVAAWALDPDSLAAAAAVEAALVVSAGPDGPLAIARVRTEGPRGALRLDVPARPAVVSVEARAREARVAGRVREALRLPDRVSDLLLLGPVTETAPTLEAALDRAVAAPRPVAGERVAAYLELYPPPGAAEARIEVRIRRKENGGFRAALGRALGRGGDDPTGAIAWVEPLNGDPRARPVSFTIRWPEVPEGEYAVEVAVGWPDGRRSVSAREVESVRPELRAGGPSIRRPPRGGGVS